MIAHFTQTEIYFVLSTGRTGTTFLYHFLRRHYPDVICSQEPSPSWIFNICSNLRTERRLPRFCLPLIERHFITSRSPLLRNYEERKSAKYIEISPFLYGLGDTLRQTLGSIKVIHMIRHPLSFITSTLNFRPKSWRGLFVDMPFWNLNIRHVFRNRKIPWKRLSKLERLAWQWVCINEKIRSYQRDGANFLTIRFEDLFSCEAPLRESTVQRITAFLGLPPPIIHPDGFQKRINPSQAAICPPPKLWDAGILKRVLDICSPLMKTYNFSWPVAEESFFHQTGSAKASKEP